MDPSARMKEECRLLALVAKPDRPGVAELLRRSAALARSAGWSVAGDEVAGPILGLEPRSREELARRASAVAVFGGDGTLLAAVRGIRNPDVPVMGINLGRLGFLAEFSVDECDEALPGLLSGALTPQRRMRLQAEVLRNGERAGLYECLNDVVVAKSTLARIIHLRIRRETGRVMDLRADGVIFATPTGSTAYNLSAGGPIVEPGQFGILVTPLAPHGLTARPLFLDPSARLEVSLVEDPEAAFLTADGQVGMPLRAGDTVRIHRSPHPVSLVVSPHRTFWELLAEKLGWKAG